MDIHNVIEFPELLYYGKKEYLGNGSYGFVYIIPGYNGYYVLKQHMILGDGQTSDEWKQEYTMHKDIYNRCSHLLTPFAITIVKPHSFSYGSYDGNTLKRLPDDAGASHCFIIMDRVHGRKTDMGTLNKNMEKKLEKLINSEKPYKSKHILPPYLYFGAIQMNDVISLDILKGATLEEFPTESLNYCTIGGVAYKACLHMMASFFIIAGAGFAPRDIEYVLNGNQGEELMTILDFNEVKRWVQRERQQAEEYDINIDLAHIYIDLCGLRKNSHPNPMAPYDAPTSQWKFLPNPITCPGGFFQAVEELKNMLPLDSYPFDFGIVLEEILHYIKKHWLHPRKDCPWIPTVPQFTSVETYMPFDMEFQKHTVSNLWKLVHDKEKHQERLINNPYSVTIGIINGILVRQKMSFTMDEEWAGMSLF